MVDTIPPMGMKVTEYPKFVKTPEISRMADLAKLASDLEASSKESKNQFDKMLIPETMFFLGQFGPEPFKIILLRYFTDLKGKGKVLKPHEIKAVGLELSRRKEPAPLTYKLDKFILLLSFANNYVKARLNLEKTKEELSSLAIEMMLTMKFPPIPAQINSIIESGKFDAIAKRPDDATKWTGVSLLLELRNIVKSFYALPPSKNVDLFLKTKRLKMDKRINDYIHDEGYALTPFLIYHIKSIIDKPTPEGYWSHVARYRLHASQIAENISEVRLVEVNPVTGAPFNKGVVAGVYADSPSAALAAIRKMYPYVLELKPQLNVKLDNSIIVNDFTSKLKNSAQTWGLSGDKQSRVFVNIFGTTWDWADMELKANTQWYNAFNSTLNAGSNRVSFKQQPLLDFQSDDVMKRKKAILAGNPPKELSHLLFGGTPAQMRACFPMTVSEFYLLSPGTLEALERLSLVSNNNTLIPLVNQRLKGQQVKNKQFKLKSGLTKDKFMEELKLINNDIKILKAALSSPYLYTIGYDKLLDGNSIENLGLIASKACKERVRKMFQKAKWPKKSGELVFKAPINDESDAQIMRGKFNAAMKQTGKTAPKELPFFEVPNMQVVYTFDATANLAPIFQVDRGLGYPFKLDSSTVQNQLFRFYNSGAKEGKNRWKTLYIKRDLTFTRGIYSKRSAYEARIDRFTTMTVEPPQSESDPLTGIDDQNHAENALYLAGGVACLGALYAGYLRFRGSRVL